MDRQTGMDTESQASKKWWQLIAARLAFFVLLFAVFIGELMFGVFELNPWMFLGLNPLIWLAIVLASVYHILAMASAVAVYFDRQYVASVSEWKPSGLYYLMGVPSTLIADIIAIAYLYNRHKHVGVP